MLTTGKNSSSRIELDKKVGPKGGPWWNLPKIGWEAYSGLGKNWG